MSIEVMSIRCLVLAFAMNLKFKHLFHKFLMVEIIHGFSESHLIEFKQ